MGKYVIIFTHKIDRNSGYDKVVDTTANALLHSALYSYVEVFGDE